MTKEESNQSKKPKTKKNNFGLSFDVTSEARSSTVQ